MRIEQVVFPTSGLALDETAVRCDVVSLNKLHSKCPILVKRSLTNILLTHDCLFEKPLCCPNYLKNII
jgi:hypothetical protein